MTPIDELLYPGLRSLPEHERKRILQLARRTPFDIVELLAMSVGLVIVTALTRYSADALDAAGRFGALIVNFLVAVPLLTLALGPFIVRRTRRGVKAEIEKLRARSGS